jgi:hypothetical protein
MPALDALLTGGAIHIADQNKLVPIKTLCGQALDKESTRYVVVKDNFHRVDCKVCRGIYFNETWAGESKSEPEKEADTSLSGSEETPRATLFSRLVTPINKHTEDDPLQRNTISVGESQNVSS